ncbi:hypothetical protein J1N35_010943 [Gossypium stocksii]|uniref:Uncharacterized protein n=1 Tax=Gossypium stocksii TaxID=47602 RepID=A0A9D4ACY1_9ROSI|nr:hypothetical protein J1N35_010943 [Gossypium stocksii]
MQASKGTDRTLGTCLSTNNKSIQQPSVELYGKDRKHKGDEPSKQNQGANKLTDIEWIIRWMQEAGLFTKITQGKTTYKYHNFLLLNTMTKTSKNEEEELEEEEEPPKKEEDLEEKDDTTINSI